MRPKVCLLTTNLLIVRFFLLPHIKALSARYELILLVNIDDAEFLKRLNLGVRVIHLPIRRYISFWSDLKVIFLLCRLLIKEDISLIHSVAPKAGFIGMLSGWLARVPQRLHLFQGEVWATRTGFWKIVLKNIDRLVAMMATDLLVVSSSEREFLISEKVITASKSKVLANGSISGVDMNRFRTDLAVRDEVRTLLKIASSDVVLLYVGRLNRDKGVLDLINAFSVLPPASLEKSHLVIVGPDEEGLLESLPKLPPDVAARIKFVSYTDVPESYMAASDFLVLPSYREGFGVVIIEAAAVKLPAIGSRIYGISDAIEDGQTGVLFKAGDLNELAAKIKLFIEDKELRERMGAAAYSRCQQNFSEKTVIDATVEHYERLLG